MRKEYEVGFGLRNVLNSVWKNLVVQARGTLFLNKKYGGSC
jgi:hypothetical protein